MFISSFTPFRDRAITGLQASIANRIRFAALALTMAFVSLIGLLSYGVIAALLEKNIEKDPGNLSLPTGQRLPAIDRIPSRDEDNRFRKVKSACGP